MQYAPRAHSPRHVHHASKTSPVTPEHFYLIEKGTGEVKHDTGSLPVGPGSLVLIPAGEWHQLLASETGFDYIEFQAPFDFVDDDGSRPAGQELVHQGHRRRDREAEAMGPELMVRLKPAPRIVR